MTNEHACNVLIRLIAKSLSPQDTFCGALTEEESNALIVAVGALATTGGMDFRALARLSALRGLTANGAITRGLPLPESPTDNAVNISRAAIHLADAFSAACEQADQQAGFDEISEACG